jgi:hypothetical protein
VGSAAEFLGDALLRSDGRCGGATGKILKGSISRNLMQHTIRRCKPSDLAY